MLAKSMGIKANLKIVEMIVQILVIMLWLGTKKKRSVLTQKGANIQINAATAAPKATAMGKRRRRVKSDYENVAPASNDALRLIHARRILSKD